MNRNFFNELITQDGSDFDEVEDLRDSSPQKKRLDDIRRISNIVQALENLVVQCEGVTGYEALQALAKGAIQQALQRQRVLIHLG